MKRKTRGHREPRRRDFDGDEPYTVDIPPSRPSRSFDRPQRDAPATDGPTMDATVKWFNATKGFGFAELSDGSGDAFLHIATLQAIGHDAVQPGTRLTVRVGQGAKGPQITAVTDVDDSNAEPAPPPGGGGGGGGGRFRPDPSTAVEMQGTVKWYNGDKGFGFVAVDDGGKDVFVHVSVMSTAGMNQLDEGQRVSMGVVETPKGREAITINVAD